MLYYFFFLEIAGKMRVVRGKQKYKLKLDFLSKWKGDFFKIIKRRCAVSVFSSDQKIWEWYCVFQGKLCETDAAPAGADSCNRCFQKGRKLTKYFGKISL